jgi:hypothetical protein
MFRFNMYAMLLFLNKILEGLKIIICTQTLYIIKVHQPEIFRPLVFKFTLLQIVLFLSYDRSYYDFPRIFSIRGITRAKDKLLMGVFL